MSDKIIIYRDEKNGLMLFEIDGRMVATMKMSDWSFALANPRRINSDNYDFGRGEA